VEISLYNPRGAVSALSEFLRSKCDDKYTIFGGENVTLEVMYLLNGSWKFSNLPGISLILKRSQLHIFWHF
jgi:hypothetical protein